MGVWELDLFLREIFIPFCFSPSFPSITLVILDRPSNRVIFDRSAIIRSPPPTQVWFCFLRIFCCLWQHHDPYFIIVALFVAVILISGRASFLSLFYFSEIGLQSASSAAFLHLAHRLWNKVHRPANIRVSVHGPCLFFTSHIWLSEASSLWPQINIYTSIPTLPLIWDFIHSFLSGFLILILSSIPLLSSRKEIPSLYSSTSRPLRHFLSIRSRVPRAYHLVLTLLAPLLTEPRQYKTSITKIR